MKTIRSKKSDKIRNVTKVILFSALLAISIFAACGASDDLEPDQAIDPVILDLDWNDRNDGLYPEAEARRNFRNLTSWNSRISIQDNTLVVKLLANALSGAGGIVTRTNIPQGTEYKLTFDVMFPADFEWGRGGKVGWGLLIGDGNTGCNKPDGNGASARMMWNTTGSGDVKFRPYLYYVDTPSNCGHNLVSGAQFPQTGSLEKEKWYTITIHVKSNTSANTDGRVTFIVDDETVLDEDIRWTTIEAKRLISRLTFSTFRGGSTNDWMLDRDTQIHFDNLKLERINID